MIVRVLLHLLIVPLIAGRFDINSDLDFFPIVQESTLGLHSRDLEDPCAILFKMTTQSGHYGHIQGLLLHYQQKTFGCRTVNLLPSQLSHADLKRIQYIVTLEIQDSSLKSVFNSSQEKYQLNVTNDGAIITTETYVGFVRALETFYQTISCSQGSRNPCKLTRLPVHIVDYPNFEHRGIMIDTARHFLPTRLILETIDAMMYNKMNILHWHITDDESFPLLLKSHPEIARRSAYSWVQVYSGQDVKAIVRYAMIRGVRVIPELATPAHSSSWARGGQKVDQPCKPNYYSPGGFDIRSKDTIEVVKDVFRQIFQLFPDPVVHIGGQQMPGRCFVNGTLQVSVMHKQYRLKQRQILKQLDSNKVLMYWNDIQSLEQPQDIVHWSKQRYPNTSKKVVMSNDIYRLDTGVGDQRGQSVGYYNVWLSICQYNIGEEILKNYSGLNVIGAEMLLWGHTNNEYTHHIKVWMRSSCLAEKLWNTVKTTVKPDVLRRITRHQRIMERRGVPVSPVTCQQCEFHPEMC